MQRRKEEEGGGGGDREGEEKILCFENHFHKILAEVTPPFGCISHARKFLSCKERIWLENTSILHKTDHTYARHIVRRSACKDNERERESEVCKRACVCVYMFVPFDVFVLEYALM